MNILQLISSQGMFGAENVVLNLTRELVKLIDVNTIIGVFNNIHMPNLEIEKNARREGVPTVIFPCRGKLDIRTISHLRQYLKKNRIDLIHCHGYKSNLYKHFATINLKAASLATCHNWPGESLKMLIYGALDRFFLRYFDWIVAVSDEVQKKILNAGVSRAKISIIKNGIPIEYFENKKSRKDILPDLGISKHAFVFGTVGRISREKGHIYLLRSAKKIVKEHPDVAFLIVGDGSLRSRLQEKFNGERIVFTGKRTDVARLYGCMDAFVLPSITEGLPLALLEAAASKLPIIATRVGDVPTVVIESKSGVLIDPGDEEGLTIAMTYILRNPYQARIFANSAFRNVKENYSSAKMAKNYFQIYKRISEES